jgi:hypothetical protein
MGKITQLQVWIIAIVLSIISGVLIYFLLIKPANEEKAAADAKFTAAKQIADQEPAKIKEMAAAVANTRKNEANWRRYEAKLMPNIKLDNLYTGMRQVWIEQIKTLGPKVDAYLRKDKSVRVLQANFQLPPPPTDPNAINRKYFEYSLGTVSVMGTFENITKHVERWNNFDRLVLADGLTLSGNSPQLVGTYTLRAFVLPRNADKPGAAWPSAGGGQGGGMPGMGGMGGPGMMGPMGGGPMGMSGMDPGAMGDMPGGGPPPMGVPPAGAGPGMSGPIDR